MAETESLEGLLSAVPEESLKEVHRIIYGGETPAVPIAEKAQQLADASSFQMLSYSIDCDKEQLRPSRRVKVAVVQNAIVKPTTDPMLDQYKAIEAKIDVMIDAAAAQGAQVLCLQEAWTCPFFFCTRERYPWCELAESAEDGMSTKFIQRKAKEHNMVIISPILERDEAHQDTIWNTAVVVGNNGNVIGKHRKNHIPRVGDFNESTYYMEGNTGHPVFVTQFGKIAINICYGRHHPLNWYMFGVNGAELVFNPSATVGALSEPLWAIEARNAAIANNYYTFAINRVGTESYPNEFTSGNGKPAHKDFGHFYGSSYCAAPSGIRTPSASRVKDAVLVTDVDLNLCRQVKDKWCFYMTNRLGEYGRDFSNAVDPNYKPQLIYDPSLKE